MLFVFRLLVPSLFLVIFRMGATGSSSAPKQPMTTDTEELKSVTAATVANYGGRATSFADWAEEAENSKSAQQARQLLVGALEGEFFSTSAGAALPQSRFVRILDVGCGSGRDVLAFNRLPGIAADGLEPCRELANLAEKQLEKNMGRGSSSRV